MYKLLVIDVDGTLVDSQGKVSVKDKEALAAVARVGIPVALCTGRVPYACRKIFRQLPLEGYHIFADGAIVANRRDEEIFAWPLRPAVVQRAVKFIQENDIEIEFYSATRYFSRHDNWSTQAHSEFFGIDPAIVDFDGLWERERVIKAGMTVATPEEAAKARRFESEFADELVIAWATTPAYPGISFLNIVSPQVSKGIALQKLAGFYHVPISQVMAVGDGNNDYTLLSSAGLAVAMANAPADIKAIADHVTLDINHSGLAAAIEKFLL